ncbi:MULTISPECIES: arsenate reductase/protein-tyrosine-phosphatase family protein [Serratia]|jgi:Protein-tyrosine-phosphatase|uniref:arsenate reductase/protein-tyrosine-phosphatase family protein n=1 Tax=Serratia TaxID=613 RepID=UPI0011520D56|nr:protein tyrosine phosphatase [Serratia marcescens]QDI47026.1 protein tyrosine phosphatase [Serratia marcescens]TWY27972.1 protein tyrosine phosphatase [Serratia marcescens]
MFDSILVVCVGNICRSPTAEALLKKLCPTKNIASAGIHALAGHSADNQAALIASKNGISLEGHVARQLTKSMCQEYSLILVMERGHVDAVCRLIPEVRGKTMLFAHWQGQKDIPDPYRKSPEAFEYAYNLLAESAQKWADALNR